MSGDPEMFERPSNSASVEEKTAKTKGKKQGTNKVWKHLNDFCLNTEDWEEKKCFKVTSRHYIHVRLIIRTQCYKEAFLRIQAALKMKLMLTAEIQI